MVSIKTDAQIEYIRHAGRILYTLFQELRTYMVPGTSTKDIDLHAEQFIRQHNSTPAFLGYRNYPASTCISVNDAVIHGIPQKTQLLKNGDLVSVDCGAVYNGCIADSAVSYIVGDSSPQIRSFCAHTQEALYNGIRAIKGENARLFDISRAIYDTTLPYNYGVVRDYCGHGVGLHLHEAPDVPNYVPPHAENIRLRSGMVLAIEPMFTTGGDKITHDKDKWTVRTADKSLACHYEHTVVVTSTGYEILTEGPSL